MDYIVLSALIGCALLRLFITYDIACQWSKNLASRMEAYPETMRIDLDGVEVLTAVPGFHIRAHGADCQAVFSLAFMLWTAHTVGEEVETGWAHMGVATPSIHEMGPGHRHETLNDHWGGWNFQKIITFSKLISWPLCILTVNYHSTILGRDTFPQTLQGSGCPACKTPRFIHQVQCNIQT